MTVDIGSSASVCLDEGPGIPCRDAQRPAEPRDSGRGVLLLEQRVQQQPLSAEFPDLCGRHHRGARDGGLPRSHRNGQPQAGSAFWRR